MPEVCIIDLKELLMIYIILIDLPFLIQEEDPKRRMTHSSSMCKVKRTLQGERESDKKKKKVQTANKGRVIEQNLVNI